MSRVLPRTLCRAILNGLAEIKETASEDEIGEAIRSHVEDYIRGRLSGLMTLPHIEDMEPAQKWVFSFLRSLE